MSRPDGASQFLLWSLTLMKKLCIDVLIAIAPGVWGRHSTLDTDVRSWLVSYFNKVTKWCEEGGGQYLRSSCVNLAGLPASLAALQASPGRDQTWFNIDVVSQSPASPHSAAQALG